MSEENDPMQDTQIVDVSKSLDDDAVTSMLNRVIEGRYRIKRRLARGGMGVVYLAEHVTLARPVVFKVLSYHLADDERAKSRFEREARGLSVLDHPNIVTVHDFGLEQSLTYIVMEYVEGENLSQRVRRKGRIPYDELLPIAMQTIDAIAAAHEKGIVHRDIKPSNVMVTTRAGRSDFVKVLDFGLAKLATTSVDITKGNLVGTVSYLAPEVIKGADASPASDVYSLGVMLYYLLCGSKPHQGSDDMSVLYQHVNVEPDWLGDSVPDGDAPDEFLNFIHRCMEKDPAQRPANAMEMRELLGELVSLPSISAFSIDSAQTIPRYTTDPDGEGLETPPQTDPPAVPPQSARDEARTGHDRSHSFARSRPHHWVRILAIAFTSFSVGFLILVFLLKRSEPENPPASTETKTTVAETGSPDRAAPAMGVLEIRTTPRAEVSVDGAARGHSPLALELAPGDHEIGVTTPGHTGWTRTIVVKSDERQTVDVFLTEEGSDAEPRAETTSAEPDPSPPSPSEETTEPRPSKEPLGPGESSTKPSGDDAEPPIAEADELEETRPDQPNDKSNDLLSVEDEPGGLLPVDE